ncbi:hypothetical protein TNIN_282311 [Trichonephila inaurata madagascariensis]|uniref:Uncharacterized protein n=1 Tax=Trichonephila inaurata madagascariensis TaxID=2747483 RepID=A0A8X6Y2G8_9ARAC|nr:hypothetical protein TNIN_282311 [Trichonephila inaurata madagascariensis]
MQKLFSDNSIPPMIYYPFLGKENLLSTVTFRAHIMSKCVLMQSKVISKIERLFSDSNFDTKNKVIAVRWNDNRFVSVMINFEETESTLIVQERVKICRKLDTMPI